MGIPSGLIEAFKQGWHEADDELGTAGPSGYRTSRGLEGAMDWLVRHPMELDRLEREAGDRLGPAD